MFISVDVGATNTRVCASLSIDDPQFTRPPLRRVNTHNFADDFDFICQAARSLAGGQRIDALGIGTAGTPNADKSGIAHANGLPEWEGKKLIELFSYELSCPVYYDNDGTAAALGEAHYGSVKTDFDFVIWGTGVGGAAVHWNGSAAEIVELDWDRYFSTWNEAVAGAKIEAGYGIAADKLTEAEWGDIEKIFVAEMEKYVRMRKPERLLFGGGVALQRKQLLLRAGERVDIPVTVSDFGDDFGLMGGFGLIKRGVRRA